MVRPPSTLLCCEQDSQTLVDGVLETVLLIQGNLPFMCMVRSKYQSCEIKLTSEYTINIRFFPNDSSGKYPNMVYAIESRDSEEVYMKCETNVLALDGSKCFTNADEKFAPLPISISRTIPRLALLDFIRNHHHHFVREHRYVLYEMKISIDTKWRPPIGASVNLPAEIVENLRQRIHCPRFGDTSFVIGGVRMYAHRDVLIRNSEVFKEMFRVLQLSDCYVFPDTYPQLFAKWLVDCYAKDV